MSNVPFEIDLNFLAMHDLRQSPLYNYNWFSASFTILLKKLFLKIIFLFVTFFSWVHFGMKWLPAIIFLYVFCLFISVVSYVYEEG